MMEAACLTLRDLSGKNDPGSDEVQGYSKENVCVESRRVAPHRCDPTSRGLTGGRTAQGLARVHTTPSKHQDTGPLDPLTPTANLKVLISAASPDIRDREMKKVLFRPIENETEEPVLEDRPRADDGADGLDRRPSRKQKSLSLLCGKFLALYPDCPPPSEAIGISLDEVASNLCVERRRIYDIVNVLESLKLVSRVAKNQYLWHGRLQLTQTLRELHALGQQLHYHLQLEQAVCAAVHTREESAATDSGFGVAGTRKEKSLRIMSQKFVMLFLVSRTQTVTLDLAAKVLIEENQDPASHSNYKTKVRRLYDIANVLTSLGLINKVHVKEERGRKPAFKWTGPVPFQTRLGPDQEPSLIKDFSEEAQPMASSSASHALTRHTSFDVVPAPSSAHGGVSSAPSSPLRGQTGLIGEPAGCSRVDRTVARPMHFTEETRVQNCAGPNSLTSPRNPPAPVVTTLNSTTSNHAETQGRPLPLPQIFSGTAQSHAPQREGAEPPLACFQGLPQASLVMLYSKVQRSPVQEPREGILGKRRMDEDHEDGEDQTAKWNRQVLAEKDQGGRAWTEGPQKSSSPRMSPSHGPREPTDHLEETLSGVQGGQAPLPSHYLYVPNTPGLHGLNFLLPSGHPAAGIALGPGGVPALALPYVLFPSSALSPYPLGAVAGQHPAPFVVGTGSFIVPATRQLSGPLSSPEQPQARALASADTLSGPVSQTPLTPTEARSTESQAFFQTPGTLGFPGSPATRRRGSAQRRLDIGHLGAN